MTTVPILAVRPGLPEKATHDRHATVGYTPPDVFIPIVERLSQTLYGPMLRALGGHV